MQLFRIEGINISIGAPCPIMSSDDSKLIVLFLTDQIQTLVENNVKYDDVCKIEFFEAQQFKFGLPSNETIQGHPFYKLGLRSYQFYVVENSPWIKELMQVQSIHPNFNADNWSDVNHFILTFHDNMFECLATNYKVEYLQGDVHDNAVDFVENLRIKSDH